MQSKDLQSILEKKISEGVLASSLWGAESWWEPSEWDDVAISLAQQAGHDRSKIIEWLRDANPELAARSILSTREPVQEPVWKRLQAAWLPRLTDIESNPSPLARAAIGRALGSLDIYNKQLDLGLPVLDNRKGVTVGVDGTPDIDWVKVEESDFQFGGDDYVKHVKQKPVTIFLPTFYISKYPVTYSQFQAFIDDADMGFSNSNWWKGLSPRNQDTVAPGNQWQKYANHPRENVSLLDAIAFCRWLSARLGYTVTLPSEQQWEKAARGSEGWLYPYGSTFDPNKGNTDETGIRKTSAVGIFPQGASPYEVLDMSGNVWDWTTSELSEKSNRWTIKSKKSYCCVIKGGAWIAYKTSALASYHDWYPPNTRFNWIGFRLVTYDN